MSNLIKNGYAILKLENLIPDSKCRELQEYYKDSFKIKKSKWLELVLNGTYTSENKEEIERLYSELTEEGTDIKISDSGQELGGYFLNILSPNKDFELHQKIYNEIPHKYQTQMWYQNQIEEGVAYDIFKTLIHRITLDNYADVNTSNIHIKSYSFRETYYGINSHITPHKDGLDENRLSVILLYLSNDYKSGNGGEFNILDENHLIKETITPEFGNVVVLDFTENNVNHSVNRVLRDYGRNALISFIYKK